MHSGNIFQSRHARNGHNFVALMLNFRTLTLFVFIILFIIVFYYYNDAQDILSKVDAEKEKCQQNLDSVSAQLQVVYEHKSRLDKSLQVEKENNLKSNQEKDNQLKNEKIKAENQKQEIEKRFNALQERFDGIQTQYQELQLKYNNVKQQLNELKDEKESKDAKAEESLKLAQNRAAEIQRENVDLTKEISELRTENAQLQKNLNEKEQQLNVVKLQATSSSVRLDIKNASVAPAEFRQIDGPLTALSKRSLEENHITVNESKSSDRNIVMTIENLLPPFHQVPDSNNQTVRDKEPETQKPLPDVQQINKPFDDSHQRQLLENAKFPMPPGGDRPADQDQPVLQHPLGEDQQSLLAKPANINSKQNDVNEVQNIGHLPVNVQQNADETDDHADNDDDDKNEQGLKRKSLPLVKNFEHDHRDKASEVKHKPNDVQAGARALKEPKEYPGGIGGGGGEKEEENDEYRDDEEEKKYKDPDA